jgi:predicted dehydrogenase
VRKIVVGQVGCGYWGPNLLRAFSGLAGARLKWLCDARPGRLAWALERYPDLRATADLDELLRDPEVDAVVVATEPVTHHALGRRVLDAGKHLFVEKPLAHTAAGARDLARRAKARGLSVGVGHVYLYHPGVRALKAALTPRRLGRPLYLDLARVNPGPPAPKHSVIWDLAPHEVSLAADLLGAAPAAVRATGLRWEREVLEAAFLEIRFKGGGFARVHASWRGHARVRRLEAYCENGAAYFDETAEPKLRLVDPGADNRGGAGGGSKGDLTYGQPRVEVPALEAVQPLTAECADFIASVRRRRDPESGAALGVAVTRVLEAAEASARRGGKEIQL